MDESKEQPAGHGPPWGWQPSLEYMAKEAGVDINQFVKLVKEQVADGPMSVMLGVSSQTIKNLKEHFAEFGLDSVHGQD
jgi:hypothetical protein